MTIKTATLGRRTKKQKDEELKNALEKNFQLQEELKNIREELSNYKSNNPGEERERRRSYFQNQFDFDKNARLYGNFSNDFSFDLKWSQNEAKTQLKLS